MQEFIDAMIFFIENHHTFNGKFVDRIIDEYNSRGDITDEQYTALVSIFEKWNVRRFIELKKYRKLVDYEDKIIDPPNDPILLSDAMATLLQDDLTRLCRCCDRHAR